MKPYLIDVPVAIIFFNRPDTTEKVFNVVREVRPSKLFLIQDGARKNRDDDRVKIEKCREIVENIDWDCTLEKYYSSDNLGCGMRVYSGLTKAFEKVDHLIILEDDIVASKSFFPFCKELLEKYRYDDRVNMISGMNHLGEYNLTEDSYFFFFFFSIWGWATWKRVWDKMEYEMSFANDKKTMELVYNIIPNKHTAEGVLKAGKNKVERLNKGERLTAWSYQFGMTMYLYSQLIIVPQKNLTTNIGITPDSTHSADDLSKLPKSIQRVFFMKRYEIEFPIKHPKYIIDDVRFTKEVDKIMGSNSLSIFARKVESKIRKLFFK